MPYIPRLQQQPSRSNSAGNSTWYSPANMTGGLRDTRRPTTPNTPNRKRAPAQAPRVNVYNNRQIDPVTGRERVAPKQTGPLSDPNNGMALTDMRNLSNEAINFKQEAELARIRNRPRVNPWEEMNKLAPGMVNPSTGRVTTNIRSHLDRQFNQPIIIGNTYNKPADTFQSSGQPQYRQPQGTPSYNYGQAGGFSDEPAAARAEAAAVANPFGYVSDPRAKIIQAYTARNMYGSPDMYRELAQLSGGTSSNIYSR